MARVEGQDALQPTTTAGAARGNAAAGQGFAVSPFARIEGLLYGLVVPVALLVLWQIGAALGLLPAWLVSPWAIGAQFLTWLLSGELFLHARDSMYRSLAGFA